MSRKDTRPHPGPSMTSLKAAVDQALANADGVMQRINTRDREARIEAHRRECNRTLKGVVPATTGETLADMCDDIARRRKAREHMTRDDLARECGYDDFAHMEADAQRLDTAQPSGDVDK